ncbi:hypothetical protein CKF42_10340 [Pantoea sp. ARC270]|nr:hypothetical protein CKF42_10340 [Pantoea sp. ARC270]
MMPINVIPDAPIADRRIHHSPRAYPTSCALADRIAYAPQNCPRLDIFFLNKSISEEVVITIFSLPLIFNYKYKVKQKKL